MDTIATKTVIVGDGNAKREIACIIRKSTANDDRPGIVWLGGYRSDMVGTKANSIDQWANTNGLSFCRHDYSGHGLSGGEFIDGTISKWLEESLAVFDTYCNRPQILVCSSMGAWIGLRMVQELAKRGETYRIHALLLLAPAPDFTHELMEPDLSRDQREQLATRGFMEVASEYSEDPDIFTRALFEDGEKNRIMTGTLETGCPVHIIQGMQDADVPHEHAMKLIEFLPSDQVTMTLVKDGDHRLSRKRDIALILRILGQLVGAA